MEMALLHFDLRYAYHLVLGVSSNGLSPEYAVTQRTRASSHQGGSVRRVSLRWSSHSDCHNRNERDATRTFRQGRLDEKTL